MVLDNLHCLEQSLALPMEREARLQPHYRKLLLSGKIQVYKVAEMVGYKNVDYFHIKFKKYVGISPAEYRKRCK